MARRFWRPLAAFLVLVGACVALALVVANASTDNTQSRRSRRIPAGARGVLERGNNGTDGTDGAAAEEYADRAYPRLGGHAREIQGAIKADAKLKREGPKLVLEVGFDRSGHARRRPARDAVLHQADAVVGPCDRVDRSPELR